MSAKTVVFFPEGAFGPDQQLRRHRRALRARGHRVVFIVEESFAGTLEARGFEERLMRLGPAAGGRGGARPVLEGLHPRHGAGRSASRRSSSWASSSSPPGAALLDGSRYVKPRLRGDLRRAAPDVIVRGQRARLPGRRHGVRRPWVRIVSCNPLELSDPDLPPVFSGYPAGRPQRLGRVRAPSTTARTVALWQDFNECCQEQGAPPLHDLEFIHAAPRPQPLPVPGRGRLPRAAPPLDAVVAPAGVVRAHRRRRVRAPRAAARAARAR